MTEEEDLIGLPPVAKIPDWHDMDYGQFIQHWLKRHAYHNWFPELHLKYPDDDANIWWSVKGHHDRIHAGTFDPDPRFAPPTDHIHLERIDPEIQRQLEELL